jgi:hypothetical protein
MSMPIFLHHCYNDTLIRGLTQQVKYAGKKITSTYPLFSSSSTGREGTLSHTRTPFVSISFRSKELPPVKDKFGKKKKIKQDRKIVVSIHVLSGVLYQTGSAAEGTEFVWNV